MVHSRDFYDTLIDRFLRPPLQTGKKVFPNGQREGWACFFFLSFFPPLMPRSEKCFAQRTYSTKGTKSKQTMGYYILSMDCSLSRVSFSSGVSISHLHPCMGRRQKRSYFHSPETFRRDGGSGFRYVSNDFPQDFLCN